ncbi:MFS transporter [Thermomonospora umbrina]|uniref:FSR family fosmidomycin resistance protein-like MFS transporter n=1 Tax=Thermomonospora umbrina TaxID=111806 RepID=A0A3D9SVJ3_9ACTN|nr:MFS transporter [Thermomonospora umbrina]REE99979.1 FSR family fosmidomycin resistance protein-like MFS transporter [Thermomonospora umbrina]
MSHVIRRPGIVSGTRMAVFLALVHAVNDVMTAMLGALLPTLQVRFAAGTATLAVLVAAFNISSSVTQPFLGALADRVGPRQVAAAGVAVAAVALSLIGVADGIVLVIGLLAIGGIGSAALHPVSTSIVGGPTVKNPGFAVGLFTAGGMAGFAAGPLLILFLVAGHGTGVTPWLMLPGIALALGMLALLPDWEPHRPARPSRLIDRRAFAGPIGWLTVSATLTSVAFLTFTSAVPLWLVADHGLATDAPLLGWILGAFSLAAGLGAVLGGAVAPRLGYARTAAVSLGAAVLPLMTALILEPGPGMVITATAAGALIYAGQPLLIVAAQNAAPQAPAAAAGVVIGIGNGVAGLLYVPIGVLQNALGLTPTIALTFLLPIPAALIAHRTLRATG